MHETEQTTFKLQHGPVTITVEGLPATVRPESVMINVNVHSIFEGDHRENFDAFVTNFAALGGRTTFPLASELDTGSCRSYAACEGMTCMLAFHPPDRAVAPGEEAIRAALNGQETT